MSKPHQLFLAPGASRPCSQSTCLNNPILKVQAHSMDKVAVNSYVVSRLSGRCTSGRNLGEQQQVLMSQEHLGKRMWEVGGAASSETCVALPPGDVSAQSLCSALPLWPSLIREFMGSSPPNASHTISSCPSSTPTCSSNHHGA